MEEEKKVKKLGLNPFAKEFKPSNPTEVMERVLLEDEFHKLVTHEQKNIMYLRREFDDNINKWVKVPLPSLPFIILRFSGNTSLIIRNIPNRISRKMLIQLLDKHCEEQNKKIMGLKINPPILLSEFDFVYLPVDFKSNQNKGYGFVNFTSTAGAFRFFRAYDMHKWDIFHSRKTCEIDFADIQGRENLAKHFMKSTFICDTNAYLPVQFSPPRNGFLSQQPTIGTIGKVIVPFRKCVEVAPSD
ncbi:protein terminal ear1 homolog isoform X1 [Macadamia integrifolia]|uniref:protein terminal ear1 homolog isoform X1 n=1 Tax=Macadamia integrifolia TaxID=60698 RepID=UPI001C4F73E0|nr:protein terminal ear1 homolog isoform X1 [Macadamia integrifolia]